MVKMQFLNLCTKYSVERWNKIPILRRICREVAQRLILLWIRHDLHLRRVVQMTHLQGGINLYPWPYCAEKTISGTSEYIFAPWSESSDDAIVGDCFGNYVIRHSTSYCAAMIYLATGKILSKNRQHAKKWVQTLAANGFSTTVRQPFDGGYYIGVAPEIGEYGQLYWFEHAHRPEQGSWYYTCSTYENYQYKQCQIDVNQQVTWVKIA